MAEPVDQAEGDANSQNAAEAKEYPTQIAHVPSWVTRAEAVPPPILRRKGRTGSCSRSFSSIVCRILLRHGCGVNSRHAADRR
jgi:hypothetical protein